MEVTRANAQAIAYEATRVVLPSEYAANYKLNQWANNDWLSLLASAPMCLQMIAACSIVASTEVAQRTTVDMDKRDQPIRAVLTQMTNEGRVAFQSASRSMAMIKNASFNSVERCKELLGRLMEPEFDLDETKIELQSLHEACETCSKNGKSMELAFQSWQDFIMRLHVAVQEKDGKTARMFDAVKDKEGAKKAQEEFDTEMLESHKRDLAAAETKVDEIEKIWKEVLEKSPSAGKLLGLKFGEIMSEAVGEATKIATQALAAKINPMSQINTISDRLADGLETDQKGSSKKKRSSGKSPVKVPDYCASNIEFVLTALVDLNAILNTDKGVDWEAVRSTPENTTAAEKNGKQPKPSLLLAKILLESNQKSISKNPSDRNSETGKSLLRAMKPALGVIEEISKEEKKRTKLGGEKLVENDSPTVSTWRKTASKSLRATQRLQAKQRAVTGQANKVGPVTPALKRERKKNIARADLSQQVIQLHTANLESARSILEADKNRADDLRRKVKDSRVGLHNVQQELRALQLEKTTLDNIRTVLEDCLGFIVTLKQQVSDLVNYFNQLSVFIESATKDHIKPFLSHATLSTEKRHGGSILSQRNKRTLFEYALRARCSFDFFGEVAEIYLYVNKEHITPGLNLVERVAMSGKEEEKAGKMITIENWANLAQEDIKIHILKAIDTNTKHIAKRITETEAALSLAIRPRQTRMAIEKGVREGTQIIADKIASSNPALTIMSKKVEARKETVIYLSEASDPRKQLSNFRQNREAVEAAQNAELESELESEEESDISDVSDEEGGF